MVVTCQRCGVQAELTSEQRRYPRDYLNRCEEIQAKAKAQGSNPQMDECSFLNLAFDDALRRSQGDV
jgi:hypothetical protein